VENDGEANLGGKMLRFKEYMARRKKEDWLNEFDMNTPSRYRITVVSSKRRVAAATPEPVASSQRDVREQSRVGCTW